MYNKTVLHPFLSRLKKLIGPEKFFEITTPDLITNPKEKNINGENREVFQLEGAKASALLNLNKFVVTTTDVGVRELMEEFRLTQLIHIVNFDAVGRIDVFTPSKFAYDHAFYGRSTSFVVDVLRGRLELTEGVNPADLPSFDVGGFLQDLENDYEAFGERFDAKELKSLRVRGEVLFPNAVLKGNISIENLTFERADLNDHKDILPTTPDGRIILENIAITIAADNILTIRDYPETVDGSASSPVALASLFDELATRDYSFFEERGGRDGSLTKTFVLTGEGDYAVVVRSAPDLYGVQVQVIRDHRNGEKKKVILTRNFPARFGDLNTTHAEILEELSKRISKKSEKPEQQVLETVPSKISEKPEQQDPEVAPSKTPSFPLAASLETINKLADREILSVDEGTGEGGLITRTFVFFGEDNYKLVVRESPTGAQTLLLDNDDNVIVSQVFSKRFLKKNVTHTEILRGLSTRAKVNAEESEYKNSKTDRFKGFTSSPVTVFETVRELAGREIISDDRKNADGIITRTIVLYGVREKYTVVVRSIANRGAQVQVFEGDKEDHEKIIASERLGKELLEEDATLQAILGKLSRRINWKGSSRASTSSPIKREDERPVGGIDLDPELLDLQIRRDGNGIPLPLHQQPVYNMKIEGFLPVIINITPIFNPMPLRLGNLDESTDDDLSLNQDLQPMRRIDYFTMEEQAEVTVLN